MTLQNRVDPWGQLHANPSRSSTVMGNRGILHDDHRQVVRNWVGKSWVACLPSFKGIDRKPLFQPGRYSELFLLDEATAFAAGHRPCAYCQRDRFNQFKEHWVKVNVPNATVASVSIKEIDTVIHQDRAARGGVKVTFDAPAASLPDGTMIELNGTAALIHKSGLLQWSFTGYTPFLLTPELQSVKVLTPRSIVQLFHAGFTPRSHASADA